MSRGRGPAGSGGRSRRSTMLGVAVLVALVLIVIAVVWGIQRWGEEDLNGPAVDAPIETPADTAAVTPADTAGRSIGAVLTDPEQHVDQTIFVNGVVMEVVSSTAYIIGEIDPEVQGDERMLVIGPPPPVTVGELDEELDYPQDAIEVAGTFREYDEQEAGEHVDTVSIGDAAGAYVLFADGAAVALAPTEAGAVVDVDDLIENHQDYAGEIVSVSGEIAEVVSPSVFILEGGLLVIEATSRVRETALVEGGQVRVGGPVRDAGEDIQGEFDVDLTEATDRATGDAVLVATSIHILPAQNAN